MKKTAIWSIVLAPRQISSTRAQSQISRSSWPVCGGWFQTPNAVGRATKRWYAFQGPDHMSLRVDASELNRPVVESTFVWERVMK